MGAVGPWTIPLSDAADCQQGLVGGKASKLAHLRRAGFPVPDGFCVTSAAYESFAVETGLTKYVAVELGRKPLDEMRWEEIWDAALRIRSEFLRAEIPCPLANEIRRAVEDHVAGRPLAIRSSAPGEDSRHMSFAGLHESIVGVKGADAVLDAVRTVWASLWSDAALLYRRELSLDPLRSRMAVLVQEVKVEDCSGVAFGRDPRDPEADLAIVEAVPGQCSQLVDGEVDPDRWTLKRSSGEVVQWRPGQRGAESREPLLEQTDLESLLATMKRVEDLFAWPPDVEWTGRSAAMTLLQARPITTASPESEDEREWYLSLRPGARRLKELAVRVTEDLIPSLEAEGARFAAEEFERFDDRRLASAIDERLKSLARWKEVYRSDLIPFAHGVRQLARYYNDKVRPADPYEFVRLLRSPDMLASRRNREMARLAAKLRRDATLRASLGDALGRISGASPIASREWLEPIRRTPAGLSFLQDLDGLASGFMDITYRSERLFDRLDLLLHAVLELAADHDRGAVAEDQEDDLDGVELEQRFLDAVGPARRAEALEVLRIGRVSWRLRDDDNLLLSRIESQLFRAVDVALQRLHAAGRLRVEPRKSEEMAPAVAGALVDQTGMVLDLPAAEEATEEPSGPSREKPRQLVGQPAAPGMATGKVRHVVQADDIGRFCAGEVLVCDAIQPMMTHLVPLAAGIVERRGGMLIHGAIIAREMQIPCVNGIARAVDLVPEGEIVTVDGHLGIVTVGPPEFDLELR